MWRLQVDPSFLQDTQKLYRKEKHTMEARGRRSPPKDEEVHGNLANTHRPNERRSSNYKLYTDGASSSDGSGAGLMLINPEGKEYTYALRFEFEITNNEAEYEALVAGSQIA
ncbi:reverse transcriptase domain-containing protein [Tanacetum coccineum]